MDNHYDVFIGNLSTTVSNEQLRDLFSEVGKINRIWINRSFEKITYGFIGFDNLFAAEEACNCFNNKEVDSFKITVKVSEQTKLKSAVRLKELQLHLLKDLKENKEIAKDFVQAWSEAEEIASPELQMIKTAPEPPSLTTLESTIIRYFKSTDQNKHLQVDFDLYKGKLLTNDQFDKFFNIQLTKPPPRQPKPQPKPRKIPIAYDYRSVVD